MRHLAAPVLSLRLGRAEDGEAVEAEHIGVGKIGFFVGVEGFVDYGAGNRLDGVGSEVVELEEKTGEFVLEFVCCRFFAF